jgi:hypothetical protein
MVDSIVTKDRLTIMMPIVQPKVRFGPHPAMSRFIDDTVGIKAVHNILVRKGMTRLKYPNGRFKPVAQAIMNKNMVRLRANENPADIIRDMQVQLLLL